MTDTLSCLLCSDQAHFRFWNDWPCDSNTTRRRHHRQSTDRESFIHWPNCSFFRPCCTERTQWTRTFFRRYRWWEPEWASADRRADNRWIRPCPHGHRRHFRRNGYPTNVDPLHFFVDDSYTDTIVWLFLGWANLLLRCWFLYWHYRLTLSWLGQSTSSLLTLLLKLSFYSFSTSNLALYCSFGSLRSFFFTSFLCVAIRNITIGL